MNKKSTNSNNSMNIQFFSLRNFQSGQLKPSVDAGQLPRVAGDAAQPIFAASFVGIGSELFEELNKGLNPAGIPPV